MKKKRLTEAERERELIAMWLESCVHQGSYLTHASWIQQVGRDIAGRVRSGEHLKKYDREYFYKPSDLGRAALAATDQPKGKP